MTTFQQGVPFVSMNGTSIQSQAQEPTGNLASRGFSAIMLLLLWTVGTGGVVTVADAQSATSSGGRAFVRSRNVPALLGAPTARLKSLSVQNRVAVVRESLSLNMTQLARSLGVGRAALYGWLADSSAPRLKHLVRLKALYDMAEYWRRLSTKPLGKYLIMPLDNGTSVAQMLTASRLPVRDLKVVLESIAREMLASEMRKRSSGYRSVADVMKDRGYEPLPGDDTRSLDLDDLVS